MNQAWYIDEHGQPRGPVDAEQLAELARRSQIDSGTLIRFGVEGVWKPAGSVPGLVLESIPNKTEANSRGHDATEQAPGSLGVASVAAHQRPSPLEINPYQTPVTTDLHAPDVTGLGVDSNQLKSTRTGLFFVYYGICAVLLGVVSMILVVALGASMGWAIPLMLSPILGAICCFGGFLATLIGVSLCLTVPTQSGAKRYAQTSLALLISIFALSLGGTFATVLLFRMNGVPMELMTFLGPALYLLDGILALAALVCFLQCLRQIAVFLNRHELASTATAVTRMIIATACVFAIFIVGSIFSVLSGFVPARLFVTVIGLCGLLLALVTFIRSVNLVGYVANAIPKT